MHEITADSFDLKILDALQRQGNATNIALSEAIHLSPSQISRRIQRLEQSGVLTGYAALLDPEALGLGVAAFAHVTLERHGDSHGDAFARAAAELPEVIACYSVSGDADYVLHLVAPDLVAFSELMMKRVLRLPGLAQIRTNIVLNKIKQTSVLPLDHLSRRALPRKRLKLAVR